MPTTDQILKWNGSAAADSILSEDTSTHIIQIGGKTSAQPGFKADSDTIRFRLADDSGDTFAKGKGFAALGTSGILVYLGGVSSAEAGLKQVSGPEVQVRKADDSDFCDLHVRQLYNENQYVNLNAFGGFEFQTSSKVKRIAIYRDADAGSGLGSDFHLDCYDDSGNDLGTAIKVYRSTLATLFGGDIIAGARILGSSARETEIHATSSTTALSFNMEVWNATGSAFIVPPAGLYRVTYYFKVTANGTGTSLRVDTAWNDGTSTITDQSPTVAPTSGNVIRRTVEVEADGTNHPTVTVVYNGISASPTYDLRAVFQRLSNI